jgi:hypothetical protein
MKKPHSPQTLICTVLPAFSANNSQVKKPCHFFGLEFRTFRLTYYAAF